VTAADTNGWVRTSRDGGVLTVTLDRPDQLNAQTPDTWTALAGIGAALDDDVRVVVLRGEGRAFSAGLDRSLFSPEPGVTGGLGDLGRLPTEEAEERIRGYQGGFRWLRSPGIVSIAAVQGHAIGAGAQLALACDLRVLTEDAQLRLPEATLGLVPDLTGTSNLVELVGYARALEICLTGRA
jgi:enoyl-CoA hydratase/carnithine racemase